MTECNIIKNPNDLLMLHPLDVVSKDIMEILNENVLKFGRFTKAILNPKGLSDVIIKIIDNQNELFSRKLIHTQETSGKINVKPIFTPDTSKNESRVSEKLQESVEKVEREKEGLLKYTRATGPPSRATSNNARDEDQYRGDINNYQEQFRKDPSNDMRPFVGQQKRKDDAFKSQFENF